MTSLSGLTLPSPRLPIRSRLDTESVVVSAVVHLTVLGFAFALSAVPPSALGGALKLNLPTPHETIDRPRLVFLQRSLPPGGGGGGGGNRQPAPIRHAESIGDDALTLRVAPSASQPAPVDAVEDVDLPESVQPSEGVLLDVKPMASGVEEHIGLPEGGVGHGTSTGPGSGGGVGTGVGTGIGSGQGPGFGPGSGGGSGGGAYRAGGAVSAPRILAQVRPVYTSDALARRVQGSVVLELVVTQEGLPIAIRTVRSLDAGLDAEAISAVRQWRFAPGRLAGSPVDVLVTVVLDFSIR